MQLLETYSYEIATHICEIDVTAIEVGGMIALVSE